MNLFSLMSNPIVKKALPLISDTLEALGVSEASGSPEFLRLIDRFAFVPRMAGLLKKTKVSDFTHGTASELLSLIGVQMSEADVDLWVGEIEKFAGGGEESMLQFVMGPNGRAMIQSILTRSGPQPEISSDIPTFDASTGVFLF